MMDLMWLQRLLTSSQLCFGRSGFFQSNIDGLCHLLDTCSKALPQGLQYFCFLCVHCSLCV